MRAKMLLFVALAGCAAAQNVPNPFYWQPLQSLKEYLQLTDSQLGAILLNNDAYNQWSAQKQMRMQQVQQEIAEETAKETLDPMALGVRYVEIEAICRQLKDQAAQYQRKNREVLTDAQRTKLKALEDAWKLLPVISDAQYGNVMSGSNNPPFTFTSARMGIGGGMIGAVISGGPACGAMLPYPSTIVRNGDFSSQP